MDVLSLFAALFALFAGLVAPILAAIAFARTRRLRELETRVRALETALRSARAAAPPAPPTPEAPRAVAPPVPPREPSRPSATELVETLRASAPPPPIAREVPRRAAKPTTEPAPRPRIEWERWIGVRGAALLSGLAIAVAGIFFYRHAVDQGWITPAMRVGTGIVAGLLAIAGGEGLRRRRFGFVPGALSGAGVVLLYASLWAAHRLYGMLPLLGAFPALATVTVACGWLAVRHASQTVAALGILGGFATPLLLEASEPSAIGFFGYVLLLDLGLVALGRRMRWPLLALLGVAGTFVLELLWYREHLGAGTLPVTLIALGALAVLFPAAASPPDARTRPLWWASEAAAVLLPFTLALELARRADLGSAFVPLALLCAVLEGGAAFAAARRRAPWLPLSAAAASLAVAVTWMQRSTSDPALAWELALGGTALALPFPVLASFLGRRGEGADRIRLDLHRAGALSAAGLALLFCAWSMRSGAPLFLPRIAALVLSTALLHHAGRERTLFLARPAACALLGLGLALLFLRHDESVEPWVAGAVLAGGAALAHAAAWLARREPDERARRAALHGSALYPLLPLLIVGDSALLAPASAAVGLGTLLVLGLAGAAGAARARSGGWALAATVCCGIGQVAWIQPRVLRAGPDATFGPELALALLSSFVFLAWPLALRARLATRPNAWRAAALAPLVWFAGTKPLFDRVVGERWIALLLLGTAAALVALARVAPRIAGEEGRGAARTAAVWVGAVAALFAALALPLTLDEFELRIAAALFGLGLLGLWRRLDHAGLQALGFLSLAGAGVAILFEAVRPVTYESARFAVWNWTGYAHLVPAACLVAGAVLLRPLEVARARRFQRGLYRSGLPVLSSVLGLLAAGGVFAWINLELFDRFGEGPYIAIDLDHDERRDLALSIAWIVYALALLALGMARRLSGLRWLSLGFLVLALAKVFLYDLGELEGLYRVVSLLGLGLSLLAVSLLYQRFVFPRRPKAVTPSPEPSPAPHRE